ncbi:MAG: nitrate/nitrite transporter NrtS [Pseudomonadota bacterium]
MIPRKILKRSLMVCLVVGTALNLINQPEAIFGPAPIIWWKVLLTYAVPFMVATYGAMTAIKD